MEKLRQNLISERKTLKFRQQDVAERIGVPTTTYGGWERGDAEPSAEMLVKLSDLFDCSVDDLLGREPVATSIDKRPELRPSTLKLVDATTKLNDLGIAAVIGYVARLIEEHPDFVLPQYQRK